MKATTALVATLVLAAPAAQAVTCANNLPPSNPDAIYQIHGNGTVTDTRTGLTWKQCSEGQTWTGSICDGTATWQHTWAAALALAQAHSFAGYSDWRVPDVKEMSSLIEECRHSPAINNTVFPNTPDGGFWSGSPDAYRSAAAWGVDFRDGFAYSDGRGYGYQVRLVRGGQFLEELPPNAPTLTATPPLVTAGSPVTLSWVSSNAQSCQAVAPSGVANWSGASLPPSGSRIVVLSQPGNHVFTIQCSNEAGVSPTSSFMVAVEQGNPEPGLGYCSEYYDGATRPVPSDIRFTAHGFSKVERPFSQVWGMPIDSPGLLAYANVPGSYLSGGPQYLSIPITLTPSIGRVRFDWTEPQGGTAPAPVAVTISPCPGDFRPRQTGTGDNFLNPDCRLSAVGMNGSLSIARAGTGLAGCQVPANKTVYLNIATYNLFQASGTPASTCASPPNCGVRMRVERME